MAIPGDGYAIYPTRYGSLKGGLGIFTIWAVTRKNSLKRNSAPMTNRVRSEQVFNKTGMTKTNLPVPSLQLQSPVETDLVMLAVMVPVVTPVDDRLKDKYEVEQTPQPNSNHQ